MKANRPIEGSMNSAMGNSKRIGATINPADQASPKQEHQAKGVAEPRQPAGEEVLALAECQLAVEWRSSAAPLARQICMAP